MRPARKHNAKPGWVELGGKRFYARSKLERFEAARLEFLRAAGAIADWAHEPKTFYFFGIKRGRVSYKPDFSVTDLDGSVHFIEAKGYWDRTSVQALRTMARHYPEVVVRPAGSVMSVDDLASIERARDVGRRAEAKRAKAKKASGG